ncbi:hypothetical protein ACFQ51_33800 [Streptomyces kaempferi]
MTGHAAALVLAKRAGVRAFPGAHGGADAARAVADVRIIHAQCVPGTVRGEGNTG